MYDDVQRLLRRTGRPGTPAGGLRLDQPHPEFWPSNAGDEDHRHNPSGKHRSDGRRGVKLRPSWSGWLATSIGLMAFACGSVLLGWSLHMERADLWNLGLPITLGGQFLLILGLLLHLERVWQTNQQTAVLLSEVDQRLSKLQQSTSLLSTSASSSQAFYAHLSSGASPRMLLTDLKGQLDLLAMKLSSES